MRDAQVPLTTVLACARGRELFDRPEFSVLAIQDSCTGTIAAVRKLTPLLLVLDSVLPGGDGLFVLGALARMPMPPRVLLLCPFTVPDYRENALAQGADSVISVQDSLYDAALAVAQTPRPALSRNTERERADIVRELLDDLCVRRTLLGREYLAMAVELYSIGMPGTLSGFLYPEIARAFSKSPAAVEKCIRQAIESAFLQAPLARLEALFGQSVSAERGKPTNLEGIAMLAEHVRRRLSAGC